ncbi:ion channel [Shewanella algae]|uniref:ion channel n=1 Tax=Shewanella algae TaxID=38313 RepID=UPI001BF08D81|nr:ion channel [Shewanella algae]BCV27215.1 hypothetical protein TUM3811_10750 [Shewanella algae]
MSLRYLPENLDKNLTKLGYSDEQNIGEFWFENRNDIAQLLRPMYSDVGIQAIESRIRWKTPIGMACQKAVREYIESKVQEISEAQNQAFNNGHYLLNDNVRTISFDNFKFEYKGKLFSLDDFQHKYANSKMYPTQNLSGIDLSGISIHNCIIVNSSFSYANFEEAKLGQIEFRDSSLMQANLHKASLGQIRFKRGSLEGSDVSGAHLNVVELNDSSVSSKLKFSEVSYWYLIKNLLLIILGRANGGEKRGQPHTIFLFNQTVGLTSPYNKTFREYVDWYQYVFVSFRDYGHYSSLEKWKFSASLLFTKCWSSYSVLFSWAMIFISFFALIFFMFPSNIANYDGSFFTAFYYSVVTFTTLGYGEITPITGFGRAVVIIEVLIGYVTLGSFVFLLGHKTHARY